MGLYNFIALTYTVVKSFFSSSDTVQDPIWGIVAGRGTYEVHQGLKPGRIHYPDTDEPVVMLARNPERQGGKPLLPIFKSLV